MDQVAKNIFYEKVGEDSECNRVQKAEKLESKRKGKI